MDNQSERIKAFTELAAKAATEIDTLVKQGIDLETAATFIRLNNIAGFSKLSPPEEKLYEDAMKKISDFKKVRSSETRRDTSQQ